MRVAVAGGTGLVGREVVRVLEARGHEPVVLARSVGVDLVSGAGLSTTLAGADVVVDVSNTVTMSRRKAVAFFAAAARNLGRAAADAGVGHVVVLSIVGIDRVDAGYYAGKRVQEDVVLSGPVPATVLRATQFHEFAGQLLARMRGPVALVPRMPVQPVAAREVAAALVDLAVAAPVGRAPELAGPQRLELVDLARQVRHAQRSRRLVVPIRVPGSLGRALAAGGLIPTGEGLRGEVTFAQWLRETYPATTDGRP